MGLIAPTPTDVLIAARQVMCPAPTIADIAAWSPEERHAAFFWLNPQRVDPRARLAEEPEVLKRWRHLRAGATLSCYLGDPNGRDVIAVEVADALAQVVVDPPSVANLVAKPEGAPRELLGWAARRPKLTGSAFSAWVSDYPLPRCEGWEDRACFACFIPSSEMVNVALGEVFGAVPGEVVRTWTLEERRRVVDWAEQRRDVEPDHVRRWRFRAGVFLADDRGSRIDALAALLRENTNLAEMPSSEVIAAWPDEDREEVSDWAVATAPPLEGHVAAPWKGPAPLAITPFVKPGCGVFEFMAEELRARGLVMSMGDELPVVLPAAPPPCPKCKSTNTVRLDEEVRAALGRAYGCDDCCKAFGEPEENDGRTEGTVAAAPPATPVATEEPAPLEVGVMATILGAKDGETAVQAARRVMGELAEVNATTRALQADLATVTAALGARDGERAADVAVRVAREHGATTKLLDRYAKIVGDLVFECGGGEEPEKIVERVREALTAARTYATACPPPTPRNEDTRDGDGSDILAARPHDLLERLAVPRRLGLAEHAEAHRPRARPPKGSTSPEGFDLSPEAVAAIDALLRRHADALQVLKNADAGAATPREHAVGLIRTLLCALDADLQANGKSLSPERHERARRSRTALASACADLERVSAIEAVEAQAFFPTLVQADRAILNLSKDDHLFGHTTAVTSLEDALDLHRKACAIGRIIRGAGDVLRSAAAKNEETAGRLLSLETLWGRRIVELNAARS